MSDKLDATISITADTSGVEAGVDKTKKSLKTLGSAAQQAAGKISESGKAAGAGFEGIAGKAQKSLSAIIQAARQMATQVNGSGKTASDGFELIGPSANRSAKEVERATKSMERSLQSLLAKLEGGSRESRGYWEKMAEFKGVDKNALSPLLNQLDAARKKTDDAKKSAEGFAGGLASMKTAVAGFATALAGGALFARFIAETKAAEQEQAQLAAVLKSTGEAAGWSQAQLNKMADTLASKSTYSSGAINEAQTRLLSYTNIAGKEFPRAMQAVIDMSARMGMDVKSSAETIGRALDIPSEGLTALTRQGFRFTESQKEMVKQLEATGRASDAQAIILEALESSYGGAAEAARNTFGGALQSVQNSIGSLLTADSSSMPALRQSVEDLNRVLGDDSTRAAFHSFTSWIAGVGAASVTSAANLVTFLNIVRGRDTIANASQDSKNLQGRSRHLMQQYELMLKLSEADPGNANYAKQLVTLRAELDQVSRAMSGASDQLKGVTGSTAAAVTKEAATPAFDGLVASALEATKAYKSKAEQMAEVQEQGDKLRAALKQLEDGEKGASKEAKQLRERLRGVDERLASMAKSGTAGAAGLKNVESAYATLSKRVNEYISQLALEAKQGDKVTAAQKLQIQLDELLEKSKGKLAAAEVARLKAGIQSALSMEKEAAASKLAAAQAEEAAKAYDSVLDATMGRTKSVADQIKAEEEAAAAIGLSKEAVAALEMAKLSDMAATIERKALLMDDIDLSGQQSAALRAEAQAYRDLASVKGQRAVKQANADTAKKAEEDWEKVSQTIGDTLADYIMGGGKDAATYLKRLFSTLVLQPIVQTTVGSIFGGSGGAQSVLGGGNGGILGTASNLNSLYSAFSGGITSSIGGAIGSLGSMFGSSALTSFAAGMKGSTLAAGLAGPTTAGASGAMGLGASVGAALPWVAGAAALVGLISKFDDSGTPHMGGSAMWSAATGGKTNLDLLNTSKTDNPLSNIDNQFASGFGWVQDREEVRTALSGLAQGIGSSLDSFAKSFGSAFGYEVALGFADDTSKDGAWGALRIALGGQDIVNWNDNRQSKWAPRSFADGEKGYKQFLNDVFLDVKSALINMDLPAWADQILDASSDIDTINAALQQIGATRLIFDQLGQSMQMFSGISGDLQTQLLMASGGIESLSANAGTFYQGFFDESERMEALNQQLRDALSGLDLTLDPAMGEAAKRQYRAAVEAAMAAGQGELAAQLLAMSGSFATAADYAQKSAEDAAQAAADAAAAMAQTMQDLLSERRTLSAEYLRASGDAEGYAEALRAIATEGYTDAERAAWDYNEALRSQISALDEAAQLQQSLAVITGQTAQSVQGVLQDLLSRVQATSAFRASLGGSIESARLGTMDLSGQADYLRTKESGLWSQLGSAADPVAVAEQLQQTILDRISVESQLREQLDSQTLGALQQQLSVAQSLQSAAQSMQSTVDGLRLGNTSALSPYAQLQYAGSKFDDAYARALAGDLDAWKDVQSFGQSYVGLGRDVFASSTDSADIFFKVTEAMDQLVALGLDADPQITALNTQIDLLQTVGQNTEQQTWVSEQQLQAFEQLDSVLQRQQLQQQQQADKQLALAQQQIDELRKHNELLQAQITQQAQISAEQKQRDAKLISAAEKSADAARMAEAQA